jgi:hypothetical protein
METSAIESVLLNGKVYTRHPVEAVAGQLVGEKEVMTQKCLIACESRNLAKGVTITNEVKYEIAMEIGMKNVGEFAAFKHGQSAYHLVNKRMSEHGYSAKPKKK